MTRFAAISLAAALAAHVSLLSAQPPSQKAPAAAHIMKQMADVTWLGGDGLQSAVLEGNPADAGRPYSLLLKLRDGYWIPPHWHPLDKRVMVLSGTMLMGTGDVVDATHVTALEAGGFSIVPAETHHFEGAKGETVLLLYGIGPLTTNMIKLPAKPLQ